LRAVGSVTGAIAETTYHAGFGSGITLACANEVAIENVRRNGNGISCVVSVTHERDVLLIARFTVRVS
jgi:hypothetical protein